MTRLRIVAALAAMLTALLLQATLVGPLTAPVPMSLPGVLVAVVALAEGPGTGMSFGFTLGLMADLGSRHPAGVLALSWLVLGLVCGLGAVTGPSRRSVRGDAGLAAVLTAIAAFCAIVMLTVLHADGASLGAAVRAIIPAGLGDALLALILVPTVRTFLRADALRPPRGVTEIVLGGRHV